MGEVNVLTIVLALLAVAGIWCVVEVALTVRRARRGVDEAARAVEELKGGVDGVLADAKPLIANIDVTVTEARPVIAHLDEVITQASPAATDVAPLLQRTTTAVEALSGSLERVDAILTDVSRLTGTTANATAAVGAATTGILEKVRGKIGRRTADPARLAAAEPADAALPAGGAPQRTEVAEAPAGEVIAEDLGYFTYPATDRSAEPRA